MDALEQKFRGLYQDLDFANGALFFLYFLQRTYGWLIGLAQAPAIHLALIVWFNTAFGLAKRCNSLLGRLKLDISIRSGLSDFLAELELVQLILYLILV